ncbi:MAG: hypothetical protein IID61_09055 [SAR324 cluster bacterium]|nr:hypothetical protein [SAR324 cluster bacterium]
MRSTSHQNPEIVATAIALPDYSHSQEQVIGYLRAWLAEEPEKAAKAAAILGNAEVARRYTVRPAEWYLAHTSVSERSEVYQQEMVRLSERAATEALAGAGMDPGEIGLIVSTSCTGLMIPSVESYLMNRMAFRATTRRLPLTELGCVAGAAALSQARQFLRTEPESAVLVIAVELASLTAQLEDFSLTNIVAASIFGDGAAAAIVLGAHHPRSSANGGGAPSGKSGGGAASGKSSGGRNPRLRARIVASRSVLFPETLEMMGFRNTDSGLKIFLSPRVPRFIRETLPGYLRPFLADHGLALEDLSHFLLHPGGRKVLEGLERELGLIRSHTQLSWDVLRDYGNLSSATVLFLLHRFGQVREPKAGEHGLMMAVGPGFSCEMVLLQW